MIVKINIIIKKKNEISKTYFHQNYKIINMKIHEILFYNNLTLELYYFFNSIVFKMYKMYA